MSEKLLENIKELDKLQGIIYQNLMTTFNNLEIALNFDFESKKNIGNVQELKHIVLAGLNKGISYLNSAEFKNACITCSVVRLIAISKYIILKDFLETDNPDNSIKDTLQELNLDKKYTQRFFEAINEQKVQVSKFITNNNLKKRFLIDNFCVQHVKKEKMAVEYTFPENGNINIPEWAKDIKEEALENITSQLIELIKKEDYEALNKFIYENKYF